MSRAENIRREKAKDMRSQFRNVANALAKAQSGLLESRDALSALEQHRGSERLIGFIAYIGEIRFLLREAYASKAGESEAARLFEIQTIRLSGGRPSIESK